MVPDFTRGATTDGCVGTTDGMDTDGRTNKEVLLALRMDDADLAAACAAEGVTLTGELVGDGGYGVVRRCTVGDGRGIVGETAAAKCSRLRVVARTLAQPTARSSAQRSLQVADWGQPQPAAPAAQRRCTPCPRIVAHGAAPASLAPVPRGEREASAFWALAGVALSLRASARQRPPLPARVSCALARTRSARDVHAWSARCATQTLAPRSTRSGSTPLSESHQARRSA